jgi:hypothetical protein
VTAGTARTTSDAPAGAVLPRRGPRRSSVSRAAALLVTALVLAACGVPVPGEPPAAPEEPPRAGSEVDTLVPLDEGSAALTGRLLLVADRAAEVREALRGVVEAAADAGSGSGPGSDLDDDLPRAVRALGEEAVGLLLGAPGGGTGPGLLPAVEPDRGGTATDDLITALITYAGDVGGERSRLVLELVRDPLLGDLGAWQRDPVGVISLLRAIAATHSVAGSDTAALDAAVLEIPGELTRALGYALVVAGTDDIRIATYAAERAVGHLGVVIVALELAIERLGAA